MFGFFVRIPRKHQNHQLDEPAAEKDKFDEMSPETARRTATFNFDFFVSPCITLHIFVKVYKTDVFTTISG